MSNVFNQTIWSKIFSCAYASGLCWYVSNKQRHCSLGEACKLPVKYLIQHYGYKEKGEGQKYMKPKISVIVSAYNVEPYIVRCINSILEQSYSHLEIIAIDDGSSDATGCILDEIAKKDKRLIVVHQENAGLVMVREKGISLASGDYIGFVDGDDAIEPEMYERLLNNLLETNADISHCGLCVYWNESTTELHYGTGKKMTQSSAEALRDLLQGKIYDPSLCNKLYRRKLLADSCLDVSIQYNEDLLRNFVLFSRAQSIVYEDFCGYQYWSRQNSMSTDAHVVRRAQQIVRARRCIADHACSEVRPYAIQAWLSSIVNAVNALTFEQNEEAVLACKECRNTLRANRRQIRLLIRRQQLAAWLIILSPRIHKRVYRIYQNWR